MSSIVLLQACRNANKTVELGNALRIRIASTGPRPRGRGVFLEARGEYKPPNCSFNGAAPARARSVPAVGRVDFFRHASTGPRPRGRGVREKQAKAEEKFLASTGPRPRGRGVPCASLCNTRRERASTGPRPRGRGVLSSHQKQSVRCYRFNGAAPARARSG